MAAALATGSALVGLGALVSFFVYVSLLGSLPDAAVAHMLEELGTLPLVAVAVLWSWADGTLQYLGGPSAPSATAEEAKAPVPPPVAGPVTAPVTAPPPGGAGPRPDAEP